MALPPFSFTVASREAKKTLAALLRAHQPELAWSRARKLVETGKVSVDGEPVLDPTLRLRAGQSVGVDERLKAPLPPIRGRLVFEDAHVVVVDKPTGVSSVPYEAREQGTAMDLVRELWRRGGPRSRRPTEVPLHVVHRIDKDTSGLLLFAKTKAAERALGALFRSHDVERTYLCVVHGQLTDRRLESRLVVDRGDGLRGSTRRPGQGKRAVTHVRVREALAQAALCEVQLETGKTHQIRIHLAENGHPLVGERVYIRDFTRAGHTPIAASRLLLHAATLGFEHPITKKRVRLESPLPEDFLAELQRLR
jgi:23S rRNA pseudouridine1911/1915/1917 synthase